ncbi:hypothetical protein HZH68_005267 [Vespula germanica]|uniref:Uncharacterized protein n=1 Tax=Vespula germanica TaxID=30212 RepID=A0A834KFR8_VESGE|nr:hypothetical protein HZH68_005267 [Vespula germanica]
MLLLNALRITKPFYLIFLMSSTLVAWLRVDTQTILTIANHVITKNHRISVSHSDHRTWFLHIREVRESDRGWYMCQINTDPMKSQIGYLEVVGTVRRGENPGKSGASLR